jgi:hypothetical protein
MTADKSANVLDSLDPLHAASFEFAGSSCTFGLANVSESMWNLSNFTDQRVPVNDDNYEQYIDEICDMVEAVQQTFTDAHIK